MDKEMVTALTELAKETEGYNGIISCTSSSISFDFCRSLSYEEQLAFQEIVSPDAENNFMTENVRCFSFPNGNEKTVSLVITF